MADIIRLLPDSVSNQIAAGEVVQRPASVVKELLENSVDANATAITLIIKESGKSLIQIIDNGIGMSEVDARMCFENHATSKISGIEDLFTLHTMGFRGEALASIGAVAQVDLESSNGTTEIGTRVVIESSKVKSQESVVMKRGTKISVKNIFFNIPARRNFLKSDAVEDRHIIDEFIRVALAHPKVGFNLYQDGKEIYNLTEGKLSHRIFQIFGESYKSELVPCEENTAFLSVTGYIGKPKCAKKTRGDQFIFVNNRFIKNTYISHAIKSAYEKLIQPDSFPFYVIFIDIQPYLVDVNVHPTKVEVKFEDDSMIYSVVNSVVKKALSRYQISPGIDFTLQAELNLSQSIDYFSNAISRADKEYVQFKKFDTPNFDQPDNKQSIWQGMYKKIAERKGIEKYDYPTQETFNSKIDTLTTQDSIHNQTSQNHKVVQLCTRYILFQGKDSITILDQNAAHRRVLYEDYVNCLKLSQSKGQKLLFPEHISLSPSDLLLLKENIDYLTKLGFEIDDFGKDSVVISSCPGDAIGTSIQQIIESILEKIKSTNTTTTLHESITSAIIGCIAVKSGKTMTEEEMVSLVEKLFACSNPNYTPDGKKTFITLSLQDINKMF